MQKLKDRCPQPQKFYGIFGQIELATGLYLILIEKASLMGEVIGSGSEILRVEKLKYIPLANPKADAKPAAGDVQFIEMIETIQAYKSFYFSYNLDLTKTMQVAIQELVNATQSNPSEWKTDQGSEQLARMFPNSINYIKKYAFNHAMLSEFKEI